MFENDEDKFLYLVGCALNGTAAAPADISRITKQAYGIAEEMICLINKLKQSQEAAGSELNAVAGEKFEAKISSVSKDMKDMNDVEDLEELDCRDAKDSKLKDANDITGELPAKAPEPVKPIKSPVLPAFINKAASLNAGASAAARDARDARALKEPIKLDDLASHDRGWNYTPWGKS